MAYKFTIVDERTQRPIDGIIGFRDSSGNPVRTAIPVSTQGVVLQDNISEMATIIVTSGGYVDYEEPMDFPPGEYQFRMQKKTPWLLYLGLGAAAYWMVRDMYKQTRKTT